MVLSVEVFDDELALILGHLQNQPQLHAFCQRLQTRRNTTAVQQQEDLPSCHPPHPISFTNAGHETPSTTHPDASESSPNCGNPGYPSSLILPQNSEFVCRDASVDPRNAPPLESPASLPGESPDSHEPRDSFPLEPHASSSLDSRDSSPLDSRDSLPLESPHCLDYHDSRDPCSLGDGTMDSFPRRSQRQREREERADHQPYPSNTREAREARARPRKPCPRNGAMWKAASWAKVDRPAATQSSDVEKFVGFLAAASPTSEKHNPLRWIVSIQAILAGQRDAYVDESLVSIIQRVHNNEELEVSSSFLLMINYVQFTIKCQRYWNTAFIALPSMLKSSIIAVT